MARKTVERNISYDEGRKLYYVNMDLGRDENGKRVKQYRTFPTIAQARTALREFRFQREQYQRVHQHSMTLGQWLEYWMETVIRPNRAPTTAYGYQKIIDNHIEPCLGYIPLAKLEPRQIQQYYARMGQEGLAQVTIRRHHDLLACSLRMAVKQDMLAVSPTDRVEAPRPKPKEAQFYNVDELRRLYSAVEGHWLELTVKLAAGLGLRREELCGLRWESVDFYQRTIRIKEARTAYGANIVQKETKNRSSVRTLYMPDELYHLLRWEKQRQQGGRVQQGGEYAASGYVILDHMGQPFSPNALSLAFTRFIRRKGLPALTLHGLRHSFATVASMQGANLFAIGKALGHSTPSVTGRIYTHLVDSTHTETLRRVSEALK